MQAQDIYLNGIGVFLPERLSIEAAVDRGFVSADDVVVQKVSAVTVAGDTPAPDMALEASRDALQSSGLKPEDLIVLLYVDVWHQGPDGWGPQYYIQRHLVGDGLLAVEIRHGCNGIFSGIELAVASLRDAKPDKGVLITASDNFGTPLINRWTPGKERPVVGDGASALVLSRDQGFARLLSICADTFTEMEEVFRSDEPLFPPSITTGRMVEFGARAESFQRKAMDDGTWMDFLLGHKRRSISCTQRALQEAGTEPDDIKRVVTSNMPRSLADAYLDMLGFSLSQSTWEFGDTVGHLGASDHIVSLHHLLTTNQLDPGDHVLLCGFSPGMTYKAAVLQILGSPP